MSDAFQGCDAFVTASRATRKARGATPLGRAALAIVLSAIGAACGSPTSDCAQASDCAAPLTCRAGRCVGDCLTRADCALGEECVAGACAMPVDAGRDAEVPDAFSVDAFSLDALSLDASPTLDAGPCAGADPDGDGHCSAGDCDEGDPRVYVGAEELCTPSDGVSRPRDENCDGASDEGCPLYFGRGHAVVELEAQLRDLYTPRLGDDGRELCFADGRARCARRASTTERFGVPTEVITLLAEGAVSGVAFSTDRLEAVAEGSATGGAGGLWHARRPRVDADFGPAVLLRAGLFHPTLSRDGLVLIAQERPGAGMPTRLVRATRATPSDAFGTFRPVDLVGTGDGAPFLADDDSLWFARTSGATIENYRAVRIGDGFGAIAALPALEPAGVHLAFAQPTSEAFYISTGVGSTGRYTIFRARVCRDGPCPLEPPICPPAVAGVTSPDALHCYWTELGVRGWIGADAACAMSGGHLATIHGPSENGLVSAMGHDGLDAWIGGSRMAGSGSPFRWSTSEPISYLGWATGEPDFPSSGPAAVSIGVSGTWRDRALMDPLESRCELERWPTW